MPASGFVGSGSRFEVRGAHPHWPPSTATPKPRRAAGRTAGSSQCLPICCSTHVLSSSAFSFKNSILRANADKSPCCAIQSARCIATGHSQEGRRVLHTAQQYTQYTQPRRARADPRALRQEKSPASKTSSAPRRLQLLHEALPVGRRPSLTFFWGGSGAGGLTLRRRCRRWLLSDAPRRRHLAGLWQCFAKLANIFGHLAGLLRRSHGPTQYDVVDLRLRQASAPKVNPAITAARADGARDEGVIRIVIEALAYAKAARFRAGHCHR